MNTNANTENNVSEATKIQGDIPSGQVKKNDNTEKNEIKSDRITIRLTKTERKNLTDQAQKLNISVSRLVTKILRGKSIIIENYSQELPQNLKEIQFNLNKVGTNLNQIVHQLHTHFTADYVKEIDKLRVELVDVLSEIRQLILSKKG